MSKKAPWLLALLVGGLLSLARAATAQPIGTIDEPTAGQKVSGVVRVSGFVLDFNGIDRVEVFLDGGAVPVNVADLNIPRPDVLLAFPNYVNSPTSRPGYLSSFYARALSNGPHSLTVKATDSNGFVTVFGPITVIVDNTVNQAPFGFIDIPGPIGIEGANGSFPVSGWALDDQNVDHIDFLVDGTIAATAIGRNNPAGGTALFGSTRPDVFAAFRDVPFSLFSGFTANIDTTKYLNGLHVFSVRVWDNQGASRVIGTRTVQVINNGANLPPFGFVDFPLDKASLICQPSIAVAPPPPGVCPSPCFPAPPGGGCAERPVSFFNNIVEGWALDVGARLDKGQVSYVELLLDGAIIANTRRDCVQLGQAKMNCYGINRPDVARSYSGYVNADNAGFFFGFALQPNTSTGLIDILIPTQCGPVGETASGKHTLAIRVGDEEETVTQIGAMSVDILCDFVGSNPDRPAFGYVDAPTNYQFINGIFAITGWTFDFDGVALVQVDIDGVVLSSIPPPYLYRPDVPSNDIRVPTPFVGFQAIVDTRHMSDSEHDLVVYVTDTLGRRSEIGRRKFVVLNNTGIKQ